MNIDKKTAQYKFGIKMTKKAIKKYGKVLKWLSQMK